MAGRGFWASQQAVSAWRWCAQVWAEAVSAWRWCCAQVWAEAIPERMRAERSEMRSEPKRQPSEGQHGRWAWLSGVGTFAKESLAWACSCCVGVADAISAGRFMKWAGQGKWRWAFRKWAGQGKSRWVGPSSWTLSCADIRGCANMRVCGLGGVDARAGKLAPSAQGELAGQGGGGGQAGGVRGLRGRGRGRNVVLGASDVVACFSAPL